MSEKIASVGFLLVVLLFPTASFADCTVEEMVKLKSGGSGRDVITKACKRQVSDAPRCSFTRVLDLAMQKKDEDEIAQECGPCERPRCAVNRLRYWCAVGPELPNGVKEGDTCTCYTNMGPVQGELTCNN